MCLPRISSFARRAGVATLALVTAASILVPLPAVAASPAHLRISLARVASGLHAPVAIAAPNDGTGRIFVAERRGVVKARASNGTLTNYLNITGRVLDDGDERGLLGLAFDPAFKTNGNFFVYYTTSSGDDRLARFHAASDTASSVSPSTEVAILTVPHRSHPNHNGGQLAFAKDGFLYLGVGDGGGAGDPAGNAQKLTVLLGKILRIDVEHSCGSKHYCIPSSNPFASSTTKRREIWEYGLRNPWRFSFDPSTRWLWIGDVGEKAAEEIDTAGGSSGGRNYGWDCREGTHSTSYGGSYCNGKSFVGPLYQYSHAAGRCAIIGGFVYRGTHYSTTMGGIYIFGDYCTGEIWGLTRSSSGRRTVAKVYDHSGQILTFGESASHELYMADAGGNVYHLIGHAR